MKKCPSCLKYDNETVRFCKHCGTELFFENRFPEKKIKSGLIKRIFNKKDKKQEI